MTTPVQQRPDETDTLEAWESWLAWLEDYHNNYEPRFDMPRSHQRKVVLDIREAIDRAEKVIAKKNG